MRLLLHPMFLLEVIWYRSCYHVTAYCFSVVICSVIIKSHFNFKNHAFLIGGISCNDGLGSGGKLSPRLRLPNRTNSVHYLPNQHFCMCPQLVLYYHCNSEFQLLTITFLCGILSMYSLKLGIVYIMIPSIAVDLKVVSIICVAVSM